MSGFLGFDVLILSLELAFGVKLDFKQKERLRKILLPLSDKNPYALSYKDIENFLNSSEDLRDFSLKIDINYYIMLKFLSSYLQENLKDMI